jgi:hypothetical protein
MKLHLLPEPQKIRLTGGVFVLPNPLRIVPNPDCGQAAELLIRAIRDETGSPCSAESRGDVVLCIKNSGDNEAYDLVIRPKTIQLVGHGKPGLYYGVQTLIQILREHGPRLPCVTIQDRPAFRHRGFYLDITRGKVPRLSTLKRLVDRLSAFKINQLQLYVEHVFDFAFDPDIGAGSNPLTADDIAALDRYCRERFVDLVPSLACFGHMGKVLSLPKYRKLAEVEWPARDWKTASWIQRLRGATINPRRPESKRLLERMTDDFLSCFSAPFFNMCGDETYDLGRGAAGKDPIDVEQLYLDHLAFMRKLAARHGKRLMFWGDVMLQHRRAIRKIPKDCIALDWGYSPATCFEKIGEFLRCGLDAYACPSTRGYRVVFNEVEEARGNISGYARTARRLGATGLLTTDWGDMGHFNMLPCSYHGMALGAAMSWNPDSDERANFDRAFSLQLFGDRTGQVSRLYHKAGTTGIAAWPYLITATANLPVFDESAVRRARALLNETARWAVEFKTMKPAYWVDRNDLDQLSLACEALHLNAGKIVIEQGAVSSASRRREFAKRLAGFTGRYERAWLAANKRSSLNELLAAFTKSVP